MRRFKIAALGVVLGIGLLPFAYAGIGKTQALIRQLFSGNVDVVSPADGEALVYTAAAGSWGAGSIGAGSVPGVAGDLAAISTTQALGSVFATTVGGVEILPVGTDGQFLVSRSTADLGVAYEVLPGAAADAAAITTALAQGDVVVGTAGGLEILPVGTDGQFLVSRSTADLGVAYEVLPGAAADAAAITTALALGDVLLGTAGGLEVLPVGTDGQFLSADSTADLGVAYATPMTSVAWNSPGAKTGAYTVVSGDLTAGRAHFLFLGLSADAVLTLPDGDSFVGSEIIISNFDTSSFDVEVTPVGEDVVFIGSTGVALEALVVRPSAVVHLLSNSAGNWHVTTQTGDAHPDSTTANQFSLHGIRFDQGNTATPACVISSTRLDTLTVMNAAFASDGTVTGITWPGVSAATATITTTLSLGSLLVATAGGLEVLPPGADGESLQADSTAALGVAYAAAAATDTLASTLTAGNTTGATTIEISDAGGGITSSAGSASAGVELDVVAGAGDASNNGGQLTLTGGGSGGSGGNGGGILATAGQSNGGNGAGGNVQITGGASNGSGLGGIVSINGGGGGSTGTGGATSINGGNGGGTSGAGGAFSCSGGVPTGASGAGGAWTGSSGSAGASGGNSGLVTLDSGTAASGTPGNVVIGTTNATLVLVGDLEVDSSGGSTAAAVLSSTGFDTVSVMGGVFASDGTVSGLNVSNVPTILLEQEDSFTVSAGNLSTGILIISTDGQTSAENIVITLPALSIYEGSKIIISAPDIAGGGEVRIDPNASDQIVYSGGIMAAGEYLALTTAGSCLTGYVVGGRLLVTSEVGTLVEETP